MRWTPCQASHTRSNSAVRLLLFPLDDSVPLAAGRSAPCLPFPSAPPVSTATRSKRCNRNATEPPSEFPNGYGESLTPQARSTAHVPVHHCTVFGAPPPVRATVGSVVIAAIPPRTVSISVRFARHDAVMRLRRPRPVRPRRTSVPRSFPRQESRELHGNQCTRSRTRARPSASLAHIEPLEEPMRFRVARREAGRPGALLACRLRAIDRRPGCLTFETRRAIRDPLPGPLPTAPASRSLVPGRSPA